MLIGLIEKARARGAIQIGSESLIGSMSQIQSGKRGGLLIATPLFSSHFLSFFLSSFSLFLRHAPFSLYSTSSSPVRPPVVLRFRRASGTAVADQGRWRHRARTLKINFFTFSILPPPPLYKSGSKIFKKKNMRT